MSGEIVTVLAPGEAKLPRRHSGSAQDREAQLVALLQLLTADGAVLDALAFRKALEARAPASIKALAVDCDCYASFVAREGGIGLPASEAAGSLCRLLRGAAAQTHDRVAPPVVAGGGAPAARTSQPGRRDDSA
ncbi:hypothetical protein NUH86_18805 [Sphingobium sp. JS3065]|uniref:hypothetical protein n=1 Tax=Sphingobium sp. JS3065 TaxID=2970925 RepID=UPI0022647CAF|nr:hypothetical protein [Sphingobium sp. JS3065]UZW57626.1 hypothetical protein NUH86_18805 [Sphingobium sp. JS3065]